MHKIKFMLLANSHQSTRPRMPPQGSRLGSTLYLLYVFNMPITMFADDAAFLNIHDNHRPLRKMSKGLENKSKRVGMHFRNFHIVQKNMLPHKNY